MSSYVPRVNRGSLSWSPRFPPAARQTQALTGERLPLAPRQTMQRHIPQSPGPHTGQMVQSSWEEHTLTHIIIYMQYESRNDMNSSLNCNCTILYHAVLFYHSSIYVYILYII